LKKKERVTKNKKQQLANLKTASGNRIPGTIDLTTAAPQKIPKRNQKNVKQKQHLDLALELAQKSTASMGKFDELRYSETAPKMPKNPTRETELHRSIAEEKKQSISVLNKILGKQNDESVVFDKEKATKITTIAKQKQSTMNKRKQTKDRQDNKPNKLNKYDKQKKKQNKRGTKNKKSK